MEDMRAVAVYEDPLLLRAVDIAGNVIPFVDDQALFPVLYRFMGKDCSVKACADDKIVILHKIPPAIGPGIRNTRRSRRPGYPTRDPAASRRYASSGSSSNTIGGSAGMKRLDSIGS